MAEDFDLIAEYREDQGKGASRRLRRDGKVPAIIYGGGRPPRALSFDHNSVLHQLEDEAVFSSILNVKVGDKAQAAILKDLQRHPAKRQILHMDLQRVLEDQEIRVNVPIHYLNEEIAPGVKQGGGKVSRLMNEVEVVCLPKHLPEYLEVDIAELELDEMLTLSDIKLPEGVSIPQLQQGSEQDVGIVSIHIIKEVPIEEEELDEELVAAGEVPTADESTEEGGEGDAEGESKDES